jgi:low temperature requirement protein LtrA
MKRSDTISSLRKSFRSWWKRPRRTIERIEERRVTFLELFYDLVYVVIIAELGHALSGNVNLAGIGSYTFMFIIVWWAWINGTMYHELHGHNDIRTRVFTFLQMFTVAAMAVFAHNAMGEGAIGFALSYAAFQLILTFLWWRTGVHDPNHRPLSYPYSLTFLILTLAFVASVFISVPGRFYVWGAALVISLLLPLITSNLGRENPEVRAEVERTMSVTSSAAERFGLFTIIVLGEVIVAVVQGVAGHHHLNWLVGGTAALGMLIAIGMWWIYFDFVSLRLPIRKLPTIYGWMYLHLLMTMGIAAAGAAVLNVVVHAGEFLPAEVRWLLVGAIAITLACIALLMRTIRVSNELLRAYQMGSTGAFFAGILIAALGFFSLNVIPLLCLITALMLAPVFFGLWVWITRFGATDIS